MSSKVDKKFLTKEKAEILRKTLSEFDKDIKVDLLASEDDRSIKDSMDTASIKDRSFLLHVLIETLCYILEKDDDKRKKLFKSLYQDLVTNKLVDTKIDVDTLARMRRGVALQFYQHIKQVHQSLGPLSIELPYFEQANNIPLSRSEKYSEAFDELEVIAHGGFGTVCKARHKVDGIIYAVKKIIFRYYTDSDYMKVMREVRNLSSMSNPHVVAYNNAWVQPVDQPCDLDSDELDSDSSSTDDQSLDYSVSKDQSIKFSDASIGLDSSNLRRVSTYSESSSIIFRNDSNESQSSQTPYYYNNGKSFISTYSDDEATPVKPFVFPKLKIKMMLCIQMEFCDYDLRHWLDARNEGQTLPFSKNVPDIFKEILSGVAYIHEKEIIHRDLKPQNIFFSNEKGVMKVGDFGLATLSHDSSEENQGDLNHSTNLGTLPYAAPEQRSSSVYDFKVDMYSLGIILIELLVKVGTRMEFYKIIDNFKLGIIPEEIEQNWSQYIPLLENILQDDHTLRKEAKEVLDMPLFKDNKIEGSILEQRVKNLERELAAKEKEFQEREKLLTQKLKEQEGSNLEQRVKNLEKELAAKEKEFQEREKLLTQKLKEQDERFWEQKREVETRFQREKQAIKQKLSEQQNLFLRVAEEAELLKEQMKRLL